MHTTSPICKKEMLTLPKKHSLYTKISAQMRTKIGAADKKKYLIGVSGGSDSLALLSLLKENGWKLIAVHINHHERGKDATRDAKLVKKMCAKIGVPFILKNIRLTKKGKEADGRMKRYEIFTQLMKKTGAHGVFTAHHADDQAETLLLNLVRGCGLKGLQGMQTITKLHTRYGTCRIIRPLLTTEKKELQQYCTVTKITFHEDYTNHNIDFLRNFLRHEILPRLTQKNPHTMEHLAQTQELITEALVYINQEATKETKKILHEKKLDINAFQKRPLIIQKTILTKLLHENLSYGRITECHRFIKESKNGTKKMNTLEFHKKGKCITITRVEKKKNLG